MVRGSLVNAIYSQTLNLSITGLDESAAVTLMSADVELICKAIEPIHVIWSSPLEIVLAIWLLQNEIGLALLGPLVITGIAISGPFFLSRFMGPAQGAWMEKIQTRIDATAKALNAMKGVKMLGLDAKMSGIISNLRANEIAHSLKMRKLLVIMLAFGNMSDILAPGAAFVIYVIVATVNGQSLDITSAFTALSLIALLVAPIRAFVFTIPPLIAALSCVDRVEKFISLPTKRDDRMLVTQSRSTPNSRTETYGSARNLARSRDIEMEIMPTVETSLQAPIEVKNLTLGWADDKQPVVEDVSIEFLPGSLTMVIGPVGCGKSSFLQSLLGEAPSSKGSIYINQSHVAFVSQTSWIQNNSIRNNILGFSAFEPDWYAKVVRACALDTDLEELPNGDNSLCGSTGSALSGGQKLRIVS